MDREKIIGKLQSVAAALGTDVESLLAAGGQADAADGADAATWPETMRLLQFVAGIKNASVRRNIVKMITAIADGEVDNPVVVLMRRQP